MKRLYRYFNENFAAACSKMRHMERRIGSELKFPLVNRDGSAADYSHVTALWQYLSEHGWKPLQDTMTGTIVGARQKGPFNDTVASCETGYCKIEFSLAHVGDLFELEQEIKNVVHLMRGFSEKRNVYFLGYGIQPLTPPSKRLLIKKGRSSVWDKVFSSNEYIQPDEGDDVHLFTINAASHVHVSVSPEEAVQAVNVLNGFAGPQIALNGHSNIWKGFPDEQYKCVSEKMWDWWMGDTGRVGVPYRPFDDLQHYIETVSEFKPVFIMRDDKPVVLTRYGSFKEYFCSGKAFGVDADGREIAVTTEPSDFDLHSTCYWYNARISRYYTVENRVNDQQPPDSLITIPALTLGLVTAADESWEELCSRDWSMHRQARDEACRNGLAVSLQSCENSEYAERMVALACLGLKKRGRGEDAFLEPLYTRLAKRQSPADEVRSIFCKNGLAGLVEERMI